VRIVARRRQRPRCRASTGGDAAVLARGHRDARTVAGEDLMFALLAGSSASPTLAAAARRARRGVVYLATIRSRIETLMAALVIGD